MFNKLDLTSPWEDNIASFVPHEPKEIKGQLVFPMYPPVAQGDNSHFIQRQVTDLTSIVQDTSLTQKIDVEMQKFLENSVEFNSFIKACKINGHFDHPEMVIGNQQAFKKRMQEIAHSLEKVSVPLEEKDIQQLVTKKFLQQAWASFCWERALEDLTETKTGLVNNIQSIPTPSLSKQVEEAIRLADYFLTSSKGYPFQETKLLQARHLTWHHRALQAKIEEKKTFSLKENDIQKAYEECKHDFLNVIKEMARAKGKEFSEDTLYHEIKSQWLHPPKKSWMSWLTDIPMLQKQVPEQDEADFFFTQHYQEKIGQLYVKLSQLASAVERLHVPKKFAKDFHELQGLIEMMVQMTSFRVNYFEQEKELEGAVDGLTAQSSVWKDYSPTGCEKVYQELNQLHRLAKEYRDRRLPVKVLDEIEKKVKWQTQFALREIEDFMEEWSEEIEAELQESRVQKAGGSLKTLQSNCQAFIKMLEKNLEESLSADCRLQIKDDLKNLCELGLKIEYVNQQAVNEQWENRLVSSDVFSAEKRRRVAQKIEKSSWSDQTKSLIYGLFVGMQLVQQLQQVWSLPEQAQQLRRQAEDVQRQILHQLPEEVVASIDKESSILGRYLSEKFNALKNPDTFEKLTHRYPQIQETLKTVLQQFDKAPPNTEQIGIMMETYRMSRLIDESKASAPFESLSQWWNLFSSDQQKVDLRHEASEQDLLSFPNLVSEIISFEEESESSSASRSVTPAIFSYFFSTKKQADQQLECSLQKIEEIQQAPSSVLRPLQGGISLLHQQLLSTVENSPSEKCPQNELMDWMHQVEYQCFAINVLENRIRNMMRKMNVDSTVSDQELEGFGKKHMNLVKQARLVNSLEIPGVKVPLPQGISNDQMQGFLKKAAPEIFQQWKQLGKLYSELRGEEYFLKDAEVIKLLQNIDSALEKAFSQEDAINALALSPAMQEWLKSIQDSGEYLMVRSTGAEDSRVSANAGGNISVAYVSSDNKAFCQAVGQVVRSYFGYASLQNRLNAGLNPFQEELRLAVTAQQLIGEPIGGAKTAGEIPISLVLFTNEPLYVGEEKFRVMRVSATYGHGEGVVGNQGIATDTALLLISEAQPDRLYVLYENKEKPERLAPIKTEQGVKLGKMRNSPEQAQRPALNGQLLARLYHWGIVGEKFFDGIPTDMEIVIKGNKIYPVQARPINRPALLPTYLDGKKLDREGKTPIVTKLQGEIIVPGLASVMIIRDPKELRVADTLEHAQEDFQTGVHKMAIVSKEEPANSHPVVNFSGFGVPCLVVKDGQKVQDLLSKVDRDHPLVVCVQTGTINLWDGSASSPETFISKGFAVHPAKIAISIPAAKVSQAIPSKEIPQEVQDLLLAIRTSTTQEVALKKLQELRSHAFVKQAQISREHLTQRLLTAKFVPEQIQKALGSMEKFNAMVERVFDETEASLKQMNSEDRLRPLFHIKTLETLFLQHKTEGRLGQYTLLDVEPETEKMNALIAYQNQLPHRAHFLDVLLDGKSSLTSENFEAWQKFLIQLETAVQEGSLGKENVIQFKDLIYLLRETGTLSLWMNFFFASTLKEASVSDTVKKYFHDNFVPEWKGTYSAREVFHKLLNGVTVEDETFIHKMQAWQGEIKTLRSQLDLFSNPNTFAEGWKQLTQIKMNSFVHQHMQSASPIAKIITLQTLKEYVDIYDSAIKAMKMSPHFSQLEKVKHFKHMLEPYFVLLKVWAEVPSLSANFFRSFNGYLADVSAIFKKIPVDNPEHLSPSRDFSVAAAVMARSNPQEYYYPVTLEDIFTFIHQNLLASIASMNNALFTSQRIQDSSLPLNLQNAMRQVDKILSSKLSDLGGDLQQVGIEFSADSVLVKYNVPLRYHSSTFELKYDAKSGKISFQPHFLGEGLERWGDIKKWAEILSDTNVLPLEEPVLLRLKEVSFSWSLNEKNSLPIALREYVLMAQLTLIRDDLKDVVGMLYKRYKSDGLNESIEHYFLTDIRPEGQSIYSDYLTRLEKGSETLVADILPLILFSSHRYKDALTQLAAALIESETISPKEFLKGQGFPPILEAQLIKEIENQKPLEFSQRVTRYLFASKDFELATQLLEAAIKKGQYEGAFQIVKDNIYLKSYWLATEAAKVLGELILVGQGKEMALEVLKTYQGQGTLRAKHITKTLTMAFEKAGIPI